MEILLVESNLGDICLIKEAINEAAISCNLTVITDGSEVIPHLSNISNKIDLLILSTNILKKNALDILDEINKKSLLSINHIVIFGDEDIVENIQNIERHGFYLYYPKPFNTDEYFDTVKLMLSHALKSRS